MEKLSNRWMFYCGLLAGMGVGVDDLKHIQDLIDAEEQGLLLRLPCKVGDTVYAISNKWRHNNAYGVTKEEVKGILFTENEWGVDLGTPYDFFFQMDKNVFLTKEEAEQKLAEMKGGAK